MPRSQFITEIREQKDPRILLWDIETAPHNVWTWGKFDQNALWADSYSHLLTVAWKWLGEKKINVLGLDDFEGYEKNPDDDYSLVQHVWDLFEEADVVIAHNGINFDTRKAVARFIVHELPNPSPFVEMDTKLMAKRAGFFFSNSLNDLADEMGLGRKMETGGIKLWKDIILDQDPKAWRTMKLYNKRDVELLEQVYLRLRPYDKRHTNLATMADRPNACPKCLVEGHMIIRKYANNSVSVRVRYQCTSCGSYSSGRKIYKTETQYIA